MHSRTETETRLCHINMLNPYLRRAESNNTVESSVCEPVTELTTERVSWMTYTLPTDTEDDGLNVSMEVLKGGCFIYASLSAILFIDRTATRRDEADRKFSEFIR